MSTDIVWKPSVEQSQRSHLWQFLTRLGCGSYEELCLKAVERPAWFWDAMVKDLGIVWSRPYHTVMDISEGPAFARWFVGGTLNAYDSAVRHHARATPDRLAILAEGEDGRITQMTYAQLEAAVEAAASGLAELGVRRGTPVGIYLPLVAEAAVAMLACAKLGAIAVPMFSGFGADAIRTRLADADAKLLITADAAVRRGRTVGMKAVADEAGQGVSSLERSIVVPCLADPTVRETVREMEWTQLVHGSRPPAATEEMRPDEPFMLLYTSGTTGRPKGTVHGHAGLPIKAAQDWAYAMDVQPGDRMMWITDIGWVMGPLLVFGTLIRGATAVLLDGAIDYPDPGRVWEVAARHGVTHLGISPTAIRVLMTYGANWIQQHPLPALRVLCSTGEPWTPDAWLWLFEHVGGRRLPIVNYSGGTECAGGILGGNLLTACKPGSFAGPIPGLDASVFNDRGEPVRGQVGELVLRQPYVGMTMGFWKDPQRYLDTYWSRWPGVWLHGDWAMVDNDGLWFILGRSDDTIKVAGKRVGPAEVEAAALNGTAIVEAAAVGIPDPTKGQAVVVFAVANPEAQPQAVAAAVAASVERSLGKPFRPAAVHVIPRLPKTRNGKILRRVIRNVYLGDSPGDLSSIDDPASLEPIRALAGNRSSTNS